MENIPITEIAAATVIVAETLLRVYPTKKNISIFSGLVKLINLFIPNRKKDLYNNITKHE